MVVAVFTASLGIVINAGFLHDLVPFFGQLPKILVESTHREYKSFWPLRWVNPFLVESAHKEFKSFWSLRGGKTFFFLIGGKESAENTVAKGEKLSKADRCGFTYHSNCFDE